MATSVKPRIEQLDHMMALCIVDSDSTENEGSPPITVNESSAQSTRSTSPSWVGRLALASTDRSGHSGLARLRKKSSLNAVLSRPQVTPPSPEVTELQHWSGTCGPRSGGARSRDLGAAVCWCSFRLTPYTARSRGQAECRNRDVCGLVGCDQDAAPEDSAAPRGARDQKGRRCCRP